MTETTGHLMPAALDGQSTQPEPSRHLGQTPRRPDPPADPEGFVADRRPDMSAELPSWSRYPGTRLEPVEAEKSLSSPPEPPSSSSSSCLTDKQQQQQQQQQQPTGDNEQESSWSETIQLNIEGSKASTASSASLVSHGVSVGVRLPAELHDDLLDHCRECHLDVSWVLRRALADYLERVGYDRALRLEMERANQAQEALRAYREQAEANGREIARLQRALSAAERHLEQAKGETVSAKQKAAAVTAFKVASLNAAAASGKNAADSVRAAVMVWKSNPRARDSTCMLATYEARGNLPPAGLAPQLIEGLARKLGGYRATVAALGEETGVTA